MDLTEFLPLCPHDREGAWPAPFTLGDEPNNHLDRVNGRVEREQSSG
jgi:hypothetical protein